MTKEFNSGEILHHYNGIPTIGNYFMYCAYLKPLNDEKIIGMSEHGVVQEFFIEDLYRMSETEKLKLCILKGFDERIEELKSQLKPTNRSAYQDEIDEKYKELKQRIINLSRSISAHKADEDDYLNDEFEDMIKEMAQLKKQIFEIRCDGVEDARKFNGAIKYQIKELVKHKSYIIKKLDVIPEKFKLLV